MMWQDYFLKFTDETAWLAVNPWGDVLFSHEHAVDVVGVLYRDNTPEGEEPVAREGYHVNVRVKGDLSDVLKPYIVMPEKPARMFA